MATPVADWDDILSTEYTDFDVNQDIYREPPITVDLEEYDRIVAPYLPQLLMDNDLDFTSPEVAGQAHLPLDPNLTAQDVEAYNPSFHQI